VPEAAQRLLQVLPPMRFPGPSGTAPKRPHGSGRRAGTPAGSQAVRARLGSCFGAGRSRRSVGGCGVASRRPGAVPDVLPSIAAAWLPSPGLPIRRSRNSRSSASASRARAPVTCGQSWPISGQQLTKNGQRMAMESTGSGPGPAKSAPPNGQKSSWTTFGPDLAQLWPRCGPELHWAVLRGQMWPVLAHFWPKNGRKDAASPPLAQSWPLAGQKWPDLGQQDLWWS
jgi:hypothetical protein